MAFQKKQTQPIIAPMFPGKKLGVFHQVIGDNMPMTPNLAPVFQPLTGLYEPSAIQQLPDGRFLVVEDEKDHSFSLLTLSASGNATTKALGPGWFHGRDPIRKLDDLEGLRWNSNRRFRRCAETRCAAFRWLRSNASIGRAWTFHSKVFNLSKTCSIGLKSGLKGCS